MTLSILKSSRLATGALILSSGVFLTACTSLESPSANAQADAAQASTETVETVETVAKPDDMAMMEKPMDEMSMDDMPMDGMAKDEMHTKCAAMHEGMKTEMGDGEKMSPEGHSPEMMEKHAKCMEGKSDMGEMHKSHKHMHKPEEAAPEVTEPAPHSHEPAPEDGGAM